MRRYIDLVATFAEGNRLREAEIPPAVHDYERRATRMDKLLTLLGQLRTVTQSDREIGPLIDQLITKLRYRSLHHRNQAMRLMTDVLA